MNRPEKMMTSRRLLNCTECGVAGAIKPGDQYAWWREGGKVKVGCSSCLGQPAIKSSSVHAPTRIAKDESSADEPVATLVAVGSGDEEEMVKTWPGVPRGGQLATYTNGKASYFLSGRYYSAAGPILAPSRRVAHPCGRCHLNGRHSILRVTVLERVSESSYHGATGTCPVCQKTFKLTLKEFKTPDGEVFWA